MALQFVSRLAFISNFQLCISICPMFSLIPIHHTHYPLLKLMTVAASPPTPPCQLDQRHYHHSQCRPGIKSLTCIFPSLKTAVIQEMFVELKICQCFFNLSFHSYCYRLNPKPHFHMLIRSVQLPATFFLGHGVPLLKLIGDWPFSIKLKSITAMIGCNQPQTTHEANGCDCIPTKHYLPEQVVC